MATRSIYDQHRASFPSVSAYVVMNGAERVATVAFKYGDSRLYAYVHWIGVEMVRGFADGGGYDKHSAAIASATCRIALDNGKYDDGTPHYTQQQHDHFNDFKAAMVADDGHRWDSRLQAAGFSVFQAV